MTATLEYRPYGAVRKLFEPLELLSKGRVSEAIEAGKRYPEVLIEGPAGTGKSRGVLEYIDALCETFPGIRVLICRQTLVSIRQSVQVTLEERVWYPEHPCLTSSDATREHRTGYTYPYAENTVGGVVYRGESEIVLGGLDKPQRTFSTEYDVVFVEEAIEIGKDAWELLLRVNRAWNMPWQVSVAATNPGSQFHWLNVRADEVGESGLPVMRRLLSRHTENPCLWDRSAGDWTEEGREYVEKKLGYMSGANRERLLEGRWVSDSGLVYSCIDLAVHAVDGSVKRHKDGSLVVDCTSASNPDEVGVWRLDQVVGSIDFGFRNPGSMSFYGRDTRGYWWHLAQVYRAGEIEEWWAERFEELYRQFRPSAVVADAARPDSIKTFNLRVGRTDADPIVRGAQKEFEAGRDCVEALLRVDEQGLPGIRFLRNNLRNGRDATMRAQGRPTCTLEELLAYTWEQTPDGRPDKERPKKENDHACDELRYFARHVLSADYAKRDRAPKFEPGTFGALLPGHSKRRRKARTR